MLLEKLLPPELLDEDDPPPDLLGILLEKLFWLPELLDDDAFDLLGMLLKNHFHWLNYLKKRTHLI